MSSLFVFLSVLAFCFTVLLIAFLVMLAMPQSKMREVLKPILLAIACGIYIVSPVDFAPALALGPFGCVDDMAAAYAGIQALRKAVQNSKTLAS